jgi:hypothetical protein
MSPVAVDVKIGNSYGNFNSMWLDLLS